MARIRLTSSRHVLWIACQQYSLGRKLVVPLYSLVGLINIVIYRYAINGSYSTTNKGSATARMADRGVAGAENFQHPIFRAVSISMGKSGPACNIMQPFSVEILTTKTNSIRLAVLRQYTNVSHKHRSTDRYTTHMISRTVTTVC